MELWGGIECTVNRVGDQWFDQCRLTGHHDRPDDLEAIAALGIKRLRYPVLWERVAPDAPEARDWRWTDARLAAIRDLGMTAIVGLLHHGAGPRYTSLIDPNFPALFADHAAAAAERYSWVADWTPINEPLTTARFSALYGHWHPHTQDERSFWTALLNEIDGTRLAMKAIRRVVPGARLIQTDDLGRTYSGPGLAGVAEHYNQRRWLGWDLLAGMVTPDHPLWWQVEELGFVARARAIADDPCPADVIGVNHYVTSERFLDHRRDAHPQPLPAVGYHDLVAARVLNPPPSGLEGVLREASERYGAALAVTESQLSGSRDEQLRWLSEGWRTCRALEDEGLPIVGFTPWALLGHVGWDTLLTAAPVRYHAGALDTSGAAPRPTALARLIRKLGQGDAEAARPHPALAGEGWWRRPMRFEYPPARWPGPRALPRRPGPGTPPILITGATGTLGQALAGGCELRDLAYVLTSRRDLPIDDADAIGRALDHHLPWAVINAAGWVRVDDAEGEENACRRANADGAALLAEACAARGVRYTAFSSDLVFDGAKMGGYVEADAPAPLGAYGRSKAEAEARVAAAHPGALMIRTAAFFSPYDPHNFAMAVEQTLRAGHVFTASAEHVVTPTYVPDLVHACLDLVIDDESGMWHLASGEALSWLDFGRRVAEALALDPGQVRPASPEELGWRALRPRDAALRSTRGVLLPPLADALARHAATRHVDLARASAPAGRDTRQAAAV